MGIFENHLDVHDVPPGDAEYDEASGEYVVIGGAANASGGEGHVAFKAVSGPFEIEAAIVAEPQGTGNGGAYLLVMDQIAHEAPFYSNWANRSGGIYVGWVSEWDGEIDSVGGTAPDATVEGHYKIARDGGTLSAFYLHTDTGAWTLKDSRDIPFEDPVFVGLGAYAGDGRTYVTGHFIDVKLTQGSPSNVGQWDLYR